MVRTTMRAMLAALAFCMVSLLAAPHAEAAHPDLFYNFYNGPTPYGPGLPAHVASFDGKDWGGAWLYHHGSGNGDSVACFKEYGGRLYAGLRLGAGGSSVQVSTPLVVSLTGADGTTQPQTLTVKGLSLVPSPAARRRAFN